jgi:hypothetical protein
MIILTEKVILKKESLLLLNQRLVINKYKNEHRVRLRHHKIISRLKAKNQTNFQSSIKTSKKRVIVTLKKSPINHNLNRNR